MLNLRALFAAMLLTLLSSQVMADAASHAAAARQLLKLVNADQIAGPWFGQVNQMFAQRFAETQAPESKKAVLESYQAKADATLNKVVGWDKLEPEMVKLYTKGFSEAELNELIAFYKSPLGKEYEAREDRGESPTSEQIAAIRAILERYADVEEAIGKAAVCERYASRLDFSLEHQAFLEQMLEKVQDSRTATRLLAWRNKVLQADGHYGAAVASRGPRSRRTSRPRASSRPSASRRTPPRPTPSSAP